MLTIYLRRERQYIYKSYKHQYNNEVTNIDIFDLRREITNQYVTLIITTVMRIFKFSVFIHFKLSHFFFHF